MTTTTTKGRAAIVGDRKPLKQWSKGRVTLVGDAAHPTSPYAAYGAGMSIEDGYFLASELERILDVRDTAAVHAALQAYEDRRKPHAVGDNTPKHILSQLAEIDAVEAARPTPATVS